MKHIKSIILITLYVAVFPVHAQEKRLLTFDEYLNNVLHSNIGYLVEKYNVAIAAANAEAAKVFPDPELSVSYANNQNWNLEMGYGMDAGLSYTLETGGKRKARIRLAHSEKEMTEALLEDYFRNLRANAALAYLTALKQAKLHEIQKASYMQMLKLARADSLRLQLGLITETDARQSKLEAAAMLNEVHSSEGVLREILIQLLLFQGGKSLELPDSITGTLNYLRRDYDLHSLVTTAQNNRADLQAALKSEEVSRNNLRLAEAGRAMDLGLSIGGGYSSIVRNEIAPAPEFWGLTAGISIPLKISNVNKGAIRAAKLSVEQSERQYEAIELQICSEVMQACNRYITGCRKVEQYNSGLLRDAETVLANRTYSYERGETGLLEVLNAQRTYNDIQVNYNETRYECTASLIELQRVCGIWDIEVE
ncbi:MAG: TolC family protein [Tannerella sp.]|nr:TolC family protein [Tannerella sp.]